MAVMATIRVRVNPADNSEYVIYADREDPTHPWLAQTAGGRFNGWERRGRVADWPEFELEVPRRAAAR